MRRSVGCWLLGLCFVASSALAQEAVPVKIHDLGNGLAMLVGSGGISPKAQAAMVGVLGFSTADRIMGTVDVVGQLSAAADARGAVPCGAGS